MTPKLQECNLLVVSDLHLSEGRGEETKKFSRNEDFFFDEEFARFLEYYQDEQRWKGARWHLIINGDFLDLLQVVTIEGAAPELYRDPDHPEYGLACGEDETIFKLAKIANGHWQFFEALASFVAAGNLLTILKGNHDVEFHYEGVQAAFILELQNAFARVPARTSWTAQNINQSTVRFGDWFHYEKDLIWIEHGNRYDGANTFRSWLAPLLPDAPGWPTDRKDEIDLPLGSLFVRYLFNRIEVVEPFADNIKPPTKFIRWLLSRHPVTALRFLLGDGRYVLGKLRRAWTELPPTAYQEQEAEHERRIGALAGAFGIDPAVLAQIDALRAKSVLKETRGLVPRAIGALVRGRLVLPLVFLGLAAATIVAGLGVLRIVSVLVPAVGNALASVGRLKNVLASAPWALLLIFAVLALVVLHWAIAPEEKVGPSGLLDPANKIATLLGVRYVVMGHTHDAELWSLTQGRGEYFNTGTWTKVFSEEERLIRSDVEFIFIEGLRGPQNTLRMKLMEWDDAAGEARLLKLFEEGAG